MYKALGVILLVVGCVYYIYTLICDRKEKLQNLKEIKKAIICFEQELSFSVPEIVVLCEKASNVTNGEVSRMFADIGENLRREKNTDFGMAWENVQISKENFDNETKDVLQGLFYEFGKKSLEIELANLKRVQTFLEEKENTEAKKYAEERKLICTLGVAFCATVIVIAI